MMRGDAFSRVVAAFRRQALAVDEYGDTARAQAPGHSSRDRSVSIRRIPDRVLIYCHAGERLEDVLAAVGLRTCDLFDNPRGTSYRYPDGRIVHRTPDKRFRQSGNTQGSSLFRADRVKGADVVYVVEGEQDVLAIESTGGAAVCTAMGAGKAHMFDWEPLRGKKVVVVADRDEPGRKHAAEVAAQLAGVAETVRIVEAAVGKDAADHITAGKTLDELVSLPTDSVLDLVDSGAAPSVTPTYTDFSLVLSGGLTERPRPAILARMDGKAIIYRGKRNEFYGDPEDGKTMLAGAACAEELRNGGRVLFLDIDNNGPVETAQRMLMLGAPQEAIIDHGRFRHSEPDDMAEVLRVVDDCARWGATLVVIDCVGELMPMFGGKSDSADDYTRIMQKVAAPLEKTGAAVLLIDHLAKSAESRQYGAGGTMAKRRAVSGISIHVRRKRSFIPGRGGAAELWINKDRPGGLREHCAPAGRGGRQQFAGEFVLEPPESDGVAQWHVTTELSESTVTLDPHLEKHYHAACTLDGAFTATQLAVAANGLQPGDPPTAAQRKAAERAALKLAEDGRLTTVPGRRTKTWQVSGVDEVSGW